MDSSFRPTSRAVLVGLIALMISTAVTVSSAHAQVTLQCASSAPVYRALGNGDLLSYRHMQPHTYTGGWNSSRPIIGRAWHNLRPAAAPDGVIYAAATNGALRRYRWNGSSWDTFANGVQHEVVEASGWDRYFTADYQNRFTVDTNGHIYTVEPDGFLHWRSYNSATRAVTHRVIAAGWGQYNLIVAAGDGVIFARAANGILYRHHFHAASQRWLNTGKLVGRSWGVYDRVMSAGGDILYGIKENGDLFWYRWNNASDSWQVSTGMQIGQGWVDWATTAAPDSCVLNGVPLPARPAAPARPGDPVSLRYTAIGDVHYSYVDSEGRAVHAATTTVDGSAAIGFAAVPGFIGATGEAVTVDQQDGRVHILASGLDAEVRGNHQAAVRGTWGTTDSLGGFVPGSPAAVRLTDHTVLVLATDQAGDLWVRRQASVNAPLSGWTWVGATPLRSPSLTAVAGPTGVRIVGADQNGALHAATLGVTTLGPWTSLGGGAFAGPPSVVGMPDGTVQVFATQGTSVYTQRETAAGFPGAWTALPPITAAGRPSAILAPDGTLRIVVRADDDYVYHSGQVAPGSSQFAEWQEITGYAEQASVDPTALAVPDESTWVIGYLNELGTPKLRRFSATVPTVRSAVTVEVA